MVWTADKNSRKTAAPEPLTVADFAADSLIFPQAAEEADLSGEDVVVGNLVKQLFTWKKHMRILNFNFWELFSIES